MDKQPLRPTLLLYTEWLEPLSKFKPEDVGHIVLALLQYQTDGTILQLSPSAEIALDFMVPAIQRNNAKYDATVAKRRKAGSLGGKARARNAATEAANKTAMDDAEAHASNTYQAQANQDVRVPGPVRVPVPDPVPDPVPTLSTIERDRDAEFAILSDAYPRKEAIAEARRIYDNVEAPLDVLLAAIQGQKQSDQWQREDGRYIPQLARWLAGERWKDQCQRTSPGYIRHGDPPTPAMIASIQAMLQEPDYSTEAE